MTTFEKIMDELHDKSMDILNIELENILINLDDILDDWALDNKNIEANRLQVKIFIEKKIRKLINTL